MRKIENFIYNLLIKINKLNDYDLKNIQLSISLFIFLLFILFILIGWIMGIHHEKIRILEIIKDYNCFHK